MQLSKYFTEAEFIYSNTAIKHNINNRFEKEEHRQNAINLCNLLDAIREIFGRLKVTSGYRAQRLNKLVGGEPNSQHTKGSAADVFPIDSPIEEVWEWVKKNWQGGHAINRKKNFIHLDIGPKRTWTY